MPCIVEGIVTLGGVTEVSTPLELDAREVMAAEYGCMGRGEAALCARGSLSGGGVGEGDATL